MSDTFNNGTPKMSRPAHRALTNAGYRTLEQLSRVRERDIAALHGMGPKSICELKQALSDQGLSFAAD